MPTQFTFPFRYTPHPLCKRAALIVQEKLKEMGVEEGKMYGVLIVRRDLEGPFFFLAAYSGQLNGSYCHPWFVPPVVDYLAPDGYFQREQGEIMELGRRMEAMRDSQERKEWQQRVAQLCAERDEAVQEAKRAYLEGKKKRGWERKEKREEEKRYQEMIRESQFQKAEIQRAKRLHREEIAELEQRLAELNATIHALYEERRQRSEALQQWLFAQFRFLNADGGSKQLTDLFAAAHCIPSGAGECCAPKLLQAAYKLGLQPLAMAEFWWGPSTPGHFKEPGAFFPACHSKCRPILTFMLQGLNVEPDPALHYEQTLKPVRVVWEDAFLAVIEKPEGWCSIPGKSDQANLFDEAHRLWPDIEGSVVVHRLDQDTSGVMVLAKTARVHRALSQQFERREIHKRYVAILEALPQTSVREGTLSIPLAPDTDHLPRQRVDWENGKEAVTAYEVIGEEEKGTRVRFYPQTGRTHQLRVHAAAREGLNAPIVGDRLYGHVADRLYLHAEMLDFTHPVTHERLHFEVSAPF